MLVYQQQAGKQPLKLQWNHSGLRGQRTKLLTPRCKHSYNGGHKHSRYASYTVLWLLVCLCHLDILILPAPNGTAPLQTHKTRFNKMKACLSCCAEGRRRREGESPVRTSELRGEQQSLQQRVQVARPSLVLNAAQVASSTGRRWLVTPFGSSFFGGGRREAFVLLVFKKISKHSELSFSLCSISKAANRVLALRRALLLSHLRLAEFSVDNGWTHSEVRGIYGVKHCDSYPLCLYYVIVVTESARLQRANQSQPFTDEQIDRLA